MELLLFGFWDIPISYYWLFYGILGLVGFLLCYFNRYLLALVIPIIVWFAVSDFQHFYKSLNVNPSDSYVFSAFLAMLFAVAVSVFGAIANKRKVKHLK